MSFRNSNSSLRTQIYSLQKNKCAQLSLNRMSLSTRNLEELREVFADIPNTEGVSMLQRIARLYLYRLNQQNLTSAEGTRTDFILV